MTSRRVGRPKGTTKTLKVVYYRRVSPEMKIVLDRVLAFFKGATDPQKNEMLHQLGAHMDCQNNNFCDGLIDCSECKFCKLYFDE